MGSLRAFIGWMLVGLVAGGLFWGFDVPELIRRSGIAWSCSDGDGDPSCQKRLRAYGHLLSERGHLREAILPYQRSAESGDVEAMFHLGWVHEQLAWNELSGLSETRWKAIRRSLKWSIKWSTEHGKPPTPKRHFKRNPSAMSEMLVRVSNKRLRSMKTATSSSSSHVRQALRWYRRSADAGFAPAANNLGEYYFNGLAASRSCTDSFYWYKKAADAGNPAAKLNVSVAYDYGCGVTQSDVKAGKWERVYPLPEEKPADLREPTFSRTTVKGLSLPAEAGLEMVSLSGIIDMTVQLFSTRAAFEEEDKLERKAQAPVARKPPVGASEKQPSRPGPVAPLRVMRGSNALDDLQKKLEQEMQ